MTRVFTSLVLLALLLSKSAVAEELRFVRHPAPSPNGDRVAFSYQGDIWIAPSESGEARRITVHPARDDRAVFDRSGNRIAFDSDRYGNDDVFVMDLEKGGLTRLTFHSSTDRVCGFDGSGEHVYFLSYRPCKTFVRPLLYKISVPGGMPVRICGAEAKQAAVSCDDRCAAIVRGGVAWWRRGYRGSAEMSIWLSRPGEKRFGALVEDPGNHTHPMWPPDAKVLYYLSDRDGPRNIWRLDLRSLASERVTAFEEYDVRSPRLSADGNTMVFTAGDGLYVMNPAEGAPRQIRVVAPLDRPDDDREVKLFDRGASSFALAPGEKEAAVAIRGAVYVVEVPKKADDDEPLENRANPVASGGKGPVREIDPAWHPDGGRLVFASDARGNYDLYEAVSADDGEPSLARAFEKTVTPLVTGPLDESGPVFSPDGNQLAFKRGLGDLVVLDLETSEEILILKGWNLGSYSWSPDGRWLAYSRSDGEFNDDVFVIPSDGTGKPVNISQHPDDDHDPVWFPNGRGIVFVSQRNNDDGDLWLAYLRKEDVQSSARDLWRAWTGREKDETDGKEEKSPPEVIIDAKDIHLRLKQLTSLLGDESRPVVSADSLTVVFQAESEGRRGLWSIGWDGTDLSGFAKSTSPESGLAWAAKGNEFFFLDGGGRLYGLTTGGKKRSLPFEAAVVLDPPQDRRQMFCEAWRLLKNRFYDPGFHGADWDAMRDRYEPVAMAAATPEDFADAIEMMLGELNASHLGCSAPGRDGRRDATGCLGVTFDLGHDGPGLKIESVLENAPAHRQASRLEPGEVILSVNGAAVGAKANLHRLLEGTADRCVRLEVASLDDQTRTVVIRPASTGAVAGCLYEAYVKSNRQAVAERSGGRLAYVHVKSMNWRSFERFERELYAVAHGKDGLIVDVRNNGGGWTADMLLAILMVPPHAVTRARGGTRGYPQGRRPLYAWTKPAAVLCNEGSFSNAEIFSHAFKTLKRGPLVGRPTHGGVISTGGTTLLDGTWLRLPFRGWYVYPDGPDMEMNGAEPDHDVPLEPADEDAGQDPQLDKAVDVLMADLDKE